MEVELVAPISLPDGSIVSLGAPLYRKGFTEVFQAIRTIDGYDEPVVVKRHQFDGTNPEMDTRRYGNASDEVLIAKKIGVFPQILAWHETQEGVVRRVNIVMEHIKGQNLQEYIRDTGAMKPQEAGRIMSQVLETLAKMHRHDPQILHLDIKLGNVIQGEDGRAYLIDFNSARPISDIHTMYPEDMFITIVTPELRTYLSPDLEGSVSDQIAAAFGFTTPLSARLVGTQTDIYQAGVILYEMLVGEEGFSDDLSHVQQVLGDHLVPKGLQKIIVKATARNPRKRYHDAQEMKSAIDRWLSPSMRRFFAF